MDIEETVGLVGVAVSAELVLDCERGQKMQLVGSFGREMPEGSPSLGKRLGILVARGVTQGSVAVTAQRLAEIVPRMGLRQILLKRGLDFHYASYDH